MSYQQHQRAAIEAVLRACAFCRTVQADLVRAKTLVKEDRSPVTVADFGVQALVSARLAAAFADIPIMGEEDAGQLRGDDAGQLRDNVVRHVRALEPELNEELILQAIDRGVHLGGAAGRYWALDPIDGTKGFLRGDQYAIALALVDDGRVVLGVLGCPNLPVAGDRPDGPRGCVFAAGLGGGATMLSLDDRRETPIQVADTVDPVEAVLCESVEKAHTSRSDSVKMAKILGVAAPPYRIDSQCKYAAVARGDSSIYLRMPTRSDYEERIWDHAAGWMVVTAAGGRVSDVDGRPLDFSVGRTLKRNKGVVATNGRLHDQVIDAIAKVRAMT